MKYRDMRNRNAIPEGYKIVEGMLDSESDKADTRAAFWLAIEKSGCSYEKVLVGFAKIDAQHYSRAHFSKPSHYAPVLGVLVPESFVWQSSNVRY